MSTAAVSNVSIFQELQSFYQNRQADLKQLGSALQSGDLNGAQQAFTALAVLGEGGPFANSEPFSKSSRAQAFNAIGEDLQAGDLARAQTAFATLTSHQGSSQASPAAVVNLTGTQPSNASDNASSIYQQLQAYRHQRLADLAQLGQALQSDDLNGAQQAFDALTALGQSGPYKSRQPFQRADRAQDFQAIGQALQSGDLAGAQSAFADLAGTFGKQSQQAQTAISAYNSSATETIINFLGPPTHIHPTEPPVSQGPPTKPPVSVGPPPTKPPVSVGPPVVHRPPIEPPVFDRTPVGPPAFQRPPIEPPVSIGPPTTKPPVSVEPPVVHGPPIEPPVSRPPISTGSGSGSAGAQVTIDETQGKNGNSAEQVTINLNQQKNNELILNLLNSTSTSQTQNSSSNALSVSA
jgi:hypothetical protein